MDSTPPLDRIAPTRRPPGPNAGTQRWRELLFAHWPVPADVVRPLIPAPLELDLWEGQMWIGVVPFRMEAVRPRWLPRAAALDFLELNVRTYVHLEGEPGVWFFSLEASSYLAVQAARVGWSLPYHHARMHTQRRGDETVYRSIRRSDPAAHFDAEYVVGASLGPSRPGSFEHYLLERYVLFAHRRGRILKGQVHHPPYIAHRAELRRMTQTLTAAAGLPALGEPPQVLHWSPGVDVEVFGPAAHGGG